MKLTPLDIHHKEFRRSIRGYNEEEVDLFLDQVAEEFERFFKENAELKEQVESMMGKVKQYEGVEQTLQKALFTGQQAADQVEQSAKRESEIIISDAEKKAIEIIQEVRAEKEAVLAELRSLRDAEAAFRLKFKELLGRYTDELSGAKLVEAPPEVEREMAQAPVAPVFEPETPDLEEAVLPADTPGEPEIERSEEPVMAIHSDESSEVDRPVESDELGQVDEPAAQAIEPAPAAIEPAPAAIEPAPAAIEPAPAAIEPAPQVFAETASIEEFAAPPMNIPNPESTGSDFFVDEPLIEDSKVEEAANADEDIIPSPSTKLGTGAGYFDDVGESASSFGRSQAPRGEADDSEPTAFKITLGAPEHIHEQAVPEFDPLSTGEKKTEPKPDAKSTDVVSSFFDDDLGGD